MSQHHPPIDNINSENEKPDKLNKWRRVLPKTREVGKKTLFGFSATILGVVSGK